MQRPEILAAGNVPPLMEGLQFSVCILELVQESMKLPGVHFKTCQQQLHDVYPQTIETHAM